MSLAPDLPRFITFEGGEGTGKSTQIGLLAEWLEQGGAQVVCTREPGGTEGAERIRALLVEGRVDRWSAATELLLMTAARLDHVERVVRPALAAGRIVLCDRFIDSSRVYQGLAGGLGLKTVDALQELMLAEPRPERTVLLDLDVATAGARRHAAGGGGRFEAKGAAFHEAVRAGFLALAAAEPGRFLVVDAALPVAEVAARIRAGLRA